MIGQNQTMEDPFYSPGKIVSESQLTTHGYSVLSSRHRQLLEPESENKTIIYTSYYPSNRLLSIRSEKHQKLIQKNIIRKALSRIILCRFLSLKNTLNKLKSIPKKFKTQEGKNSMNFEGWFFNQVIRTTKLTVETSFMRSILNSKAKFQRQQQKLSGQHILNLNSDTNNNQIISSLGTNVIIYPHQPCTDKLVIAILSLQQITRQRIKFVINQFHTNSFRCEMFNRYYQRVFRRMIDNQRIFILKIKLMAKIKHDQILTEKRRIVRNFFDKSLERRQRLVFNTIFSNKYQKKQSNQNLKLKISILRNIFKAQQQKLFKIFMIWKLKTKRLPLKSKKDTNQNQINHLLYCIDIAPTPSYRPKAIQINTQTQEIIDIDEMAKQQAYQANLEKKCLKLNALLMKIYNKWAFQKIKKSNRKIKMIEICAKQLACAPKINVHRSLWRLYIQTFQNSQ